jgi:hypothetical protein
MKSLEWFVPKYISAESESVSESEKYFCGSESEFEKNVFGSTTLDSVDKYFNENQKSLLVIRDAPDTDLAGYPAGRISG